MRLSATLFNGLVRRRFRWPSPDRRGRNRVRARLALALSVPALVLLGVSLFAACGADTPDVEDVEYLARLKIARTARAEHPERPLGIVLGSSHVKFAFAPEQLPPTEGVYWVNGSRLGAGPVVNRLTLHRLLRDGARPDVVVIEAFPVFFANEEVERIVLPCLTTRELAVVRGYSDEPFEYDRQILRLRGRRLLDLDGRRPAIPQPVYNPRGGDPTLPVAVTPAQREHWLDYTRKRFGPIFPKMNVRLGADRAFRDTLRTAAENEIRVVVVRMPEGPLFRSWYDPAALARFDAYLAGVATEYGVPVLDARDWLEEDDFLDSHHTLKRGAEKFTLRFARELAALPAR